MIHVDETDPVGENESPFTKRTVKISRGVNPEEKYELIRELGRGKFGTVYKCREKTTNLQLAAKFVGIPNRGDRRNVEREVDIMNILQHHLITQLYDAFEYQKMMCVVLELIEGGELFDRVIGDDFILTERACTVFVRQICEALEFIHRNHILHLDLKPENIMCLSREGNRIKIIDFGLARKFDPEKKMQILFGTPEFVAPEVVNFDPIDFGTDMWSVGVICYVLLSGLSPFMGETDIETMGNVTVAKYDFDDEAFNDISEEALDFITHLLVKEADKRMTATESLQHQWLRKQASNRPAPPPPSMTTTDQMEIPQIISDLSPSPVVTLSQCEDESLPPTVSPPSEMEQLDEEPLAPPPPLPRTAPPPIELLIESSLPIIIPPVSQELQPPESVLIAERDQLLAGNEAAQQLTRENIADLSNGTDKTLELTKDNLKTFVERWDGTRPVEVPLPTGGQLLLKSPSTSSLKRAKDTAKGKKEKSADQKKTKYNDVAKSSDFIAPTRSDNDSSLDSDGTKPTPFGAQEPLQLQETAAKEDNDVRANGMKDKKTITEKAPAALNITKNLLEQLDQIQIKSPKEKQDAAQNERPAVNGVNYLKVDNNLPTSSSPTDSALSSRGCSPSPCESLASTADLEDSFDATAVKMPSGVLQDYLQTFDRRKSDSNYVLGNKKNNPAVKEEKMDLVDEIKRLSDHLMMLNSLQTEMSEKTENVAEDKESAAAPKKPSSKRSPSPNPQTMNDSSERRDSRTKLTDPSNLSSKLESKIVKSQIMRFSNESSSQVVSQSQVNSTTGAANVHSFNGSSSVRTATRLIEQMHKPQTPISQPPWMLKCKRTKFRMTELSRDVPQNAPDSHKTIFIEEAATNTKDCLLQLLDKYNHNTTNEFEKRSLEIDRSVIPSSSSSSSSSIASLASPTSPVANKGQESKVTKTETTESCSQNGSVTTKRTVTKTTTTTKKTSTVTSRTVKKSQGREDNGQVDTEIEGKTHPDQPEFAKSIPRHFSLTNWDKDGIEESTMNSLNSFFQRHSSQVGSTIVKQIQQQIEGKRVPQK